MKEYLGDGCYVNYDGESIILTTENGVSVTNEIYLDPEAMVNLSRYCDRVAGTHFTRSP